MIFSEFQEMTDYQFDKSILSSEILATLPAGLEMRPLASDDFDKGNVHAAQTCNLNL